MTDYECNICLNKGCVFKQAGETDTLGKCYGYEPPAIEIFGYIYEPDGIGRYEVCYCKDCKNVHCMWCGKDKYVYCNDMKCNNDRF